MEQYIETVQKVKRPLADEPDTTDQKELDRAKEKVNLELLDAIYRHQILKKSQLER